MIETKESDKQQSASRTQLITRLKKPPILVNSAITKRKKDQPVPLSYSQERLWIMSRLEPDNPIYNVAGAVQFDGLLNVQALTQSLDEVVRRHEVLRSLFIAEGQQVLPDSRLPLAYLDVSGFSRESAMELFLQRADDFIYQPILLTGRPPLRALLVGLSAQRHILLLALHHIVSDRWSVGVLMQEVAALYAAYGHGKPSSLPELPIQYGDFCVWQRTQQEKWAKHLDYWQQKMTGAPPFLELPADRPRPPVLSYRGNVYSFEISAELSQALTELGKQYQVTLFMVMAAAFNTLLYRYTGSQDICIGYPVAGRGQSQTTALIGFFVNTLVLRCQIEADLPFSELLLQLRKQALQDQNHQELSFGQLLDALNPVRNTSHTPLFQVMLAVQNVPMPDFRMPDLLVVPMTMNTRIAQFDLTLYIDERDGKLLGSFEYNTDLFDATTIARTAGHLQMLLASGADNPSLPLNRLQMLAASERQQLLTGFNRTAIDYAGEQLIHCLFEKQVQETPDAIALIYEGQTISYDRLNRRANRLAHHLLSMGVGCEDRVAICLERGFDMVAGLLGILKAGAAYVPLDPDYPAERLEYMFADCLPAALITRGNLLGRLPAADRGRTPVIVMDDHQNTVAIDRQPEHNPDPRMLGLTPGHLAYVIYTSGSTGRPKGAMNQHGSVVNRLLWAQSEYCLTGADRVLQKTPFSFDVSVWEFFLPLLAGAGLVLAKPKGHQDPHYLLDLIAQSGITTLHFVPSMLQVFLKYIDANKCRTLRQILCSGESLPHTLQIHTQSCLPVVALHNLYGPTEAAVDVTSWPCRRDTDSMVVPIGRAIANTAIYILDPCLEPVPLGITGEIFIGGTAVGRGYLNKPALTAERFMPDPFRKAFRMYKTGDLGRWLADGNIEYLGRNDFQIKIRGFRIELGEIENRLNACDGVREAVVIAREDGLGDKRLVAYLTKNNCVELSIAGLRADLAAAMPDYMLPSAFVVLPSLPLTANGKLDRGALPAPDSDAVISHRYEAPQGTIEIALARIWQKLLELERVGRNDHFFELGGHSLAALTLAERLGQEGWTLEARAVFANPILYSLAAVIAENLGNVPVLEMPPNLIPDYFGQPLTNESKQDKNITPDMLTLVNLTQDEIDLIVDSVEEGVDGIQDIYPLAPLQEGILFHHLLETQGDPFITRSIIVFDNRKRLDAFLGALQTVIDRHDILRSSMHWDGLLQPVQVVHRHAVLPVEELASGEEGRIKQRLLERTDPRQLRMDLRRAPLLAGYVLEDSETKECWFAMLNHHLVNDHYSLQLILSEIQLLLSDQAEQLPAVQPYRNFIAQMRVVPQTEHEIYFRRQFGDISEPTAPFGLLNVQGDGGQVKEAVLPLEPALAQRIRTIARQNSVTPASMFHAAWALVIGLCSGRDDVVFGTVLSGRLQGENVAANKVVGMFINTLPIRVSWRGRAVRELIVITHRNLNELLVHEQASLALAQRCSAVPASTPLFTALLNYRHSTTAAGPDQQALLEWEGMRVISSEERTNYPLALSIDDLGKGFSFTMQCAAGIDPERIAVYVGTAMEGLVSALEQDPQQQAGSIGIMPKDECRQLLFDFNATAADYPAEQSLQTLFEAQVEKKPDAVAVTFADQALNYAELNVKANQLAHFLRSKGVGPDVPVGLCVERSPEMVIGMLGILKAGGAYVPLDPHYPKERIDYMLKDARIAVLLTQQRLAARLPLGAKDVFCLDGDWPVIAQWPATNNSAFCNHPQDLAYIIYTSGSTGLPKGVMVSHRNAVHSTRARFANYLEPVSAYLLLSSFSFDSSVAGLFWTLGQGGCLCLPSDDAAKNPGALADLIVSRRISHLLALPSFYVLLLRQDAVKLQSLKTAIVAGEACSTELVNQHYEVLPRVPLYNEYGPTEGSVWSSVYPANQDDQGRPPAIGRPIDNVRLYILDRTGNPVPIGVEGELHIGGEGVVRGYWQRPELTAEKFSPDPFRPDGDRLYKTGDLARYRPDGNIEFLGRIDHQVKVRGFRIELGEIEAKLLEVPAINQAVVVAYEDQSGDKRLVAYLVADTKHAVDIEGLKINLKALLPDYMVPTVFVILDSLPLNANGKLDRKRLPRPNIREQLANRYIAPRTRTEEILAGIWSEVLMIEKIGIEDDFFELGGHSLNATVLLSRVTRHFQLDIPLRAIFATPTISGLSMVIEELLIEKLEALSDNEAEELFNQNNSLVE